MVMDTMPGALDVAFRTALLLTGATKTAEAAVIHGIAACDDLSHWGLLIEAVRSAIGRRTKPADGHYEVELLPPELRRLFMLQPDTQAALLRVLQEREFERVGGAQPVQVDVRVIAATNRDLNAAVVNGTFRENLFYRLSVFPIEVPPLRERQEDVLMLVEYFVQRYANRAGKNIQSIDKKTLDLLQAYDWPGNIRELQNVIERSVILSSGDAFSVDELWLSKETLLPASPVETSVAFRGEVKPHSAREIIEAALAESRGQVSGPSGAAVKLGMSPSTLEDRIKALNIDKRRFKYG